jgi:hypothetical protein
MLRLQMRNNTDLPAGEHLEDLAVNLKEGSSTDARETGFRRHCNSRITGNSGTKKESHL